MVDAGRRDLCRCTPDRRHRQGLEKPHTRAVQGVQIACRLSHRPTVQHPGHTQTDWRTNGAFQRLPRCGHLRTLQGVLPRLAVDFWTPEANDGGNDDVGAQLSTDPTAIAFGTVNLNAGAVERVFKVNNPGKYALSVTSASISDNAALSEMALSPNGALTVPAGGFALYTLKFTPKKDGNKAHTISFVSNAYKTSTVSVTAAVFGPKISLSKTSIDFGTVKPNNLKIETLTVTNPGPVPLQIKSVTFTGSGSGSYAYSLEGSPQISAGAARNMTVTFAPKAEGDFPSELLVESDAGISKVSLSGSSVDSTTISGPSLVTYEPTFVGEAIRKNIQITNVGPGKLLLSSVLIKGENSGDFVVVDYSRQPIDAGKSGDLVLDYLTSAAGTDVAQVEIKSNAINGVLIILINARTVTKPELPPDPKTVAPPVVANSNSDFYSSNKFFFEGDNKIQVGATASKIISAQAGTIQGTVFDTNGEGLSAAKITILDHPEYGYTMSRDDGQYTMLVNAGSDLTVNIERVGYLNAQRKVSTSSTKAAAVADVFLTKQSAVVSALSFSGQVSGMQSAVGETITDQDGERTPVVIVPPGTKADMIMPDGSKQALANITLSVSEFTQGPNGLQAMPATLPPTSGYTFAADFSIAEAKAAGSKMVEFSKPIYTYVDNFISMPTGSIIPSGYYDYSKGYWVPSENGTVIEIMNVSDGSAKVDIDGDGSADEVTTRYDQALSAKGFRLASGSTCTQLDPMPVTGVPLMGNILAMSRLQLSGSNAYFAANTKIGVNLSYQGNIGFVAAKLIAPDGTEVILKNGGASSGDGATYITLFPDEKNSAQPLSLLYGRSLDGIWELRLTSPGFGRSFVNAWSIIQADAGINCGNYTPISNRLSTTSKDDGVFVSWNQFESKDAYVLVRNASGPVNIKFPKGKIPAQGESQGSNQVIYVGNSKEYYDKQAPSNVEISYSVYTADSYLSSLKGMSNSELETLAKLYPTAANKQLWRTPMTHFSTYDLNPVQNIADGAKFPRRPDLQDEADENACTTKGCVISIETQSLGEVLPIQGTPYNLTYSTMKSKGRLKDYSISVALSDSTIREDVLAINLTVSVAGQIFQKSFTPAPNLSFEYLWDGLDAFGRPVNGRQSASIKIDYVYRSKYTVLTNETSNSFGKAGGSEGVIEPEAITAREQASRTLSTQWEQVIGTPFDPSNRGEWSVDVQHRFDIASSTLIKGDGARHMMRDNQMSTFYASGSGVLEQFTMDNEGNAYIADRQTGYRIYKLAPNGSIQTIASSVLAPGASPSSDGGPAINYPLVDVRALTYNRANGRLLFSEGGKILEIDSSGIIRIIARSASSDTPNSCGTKSPANSREMIFGDARSIQINSQGDVYFTGCGRYVIFRLRRDGEIERVAGKDLIGLSLNDSVPANSFTFGPITEMTIAPDDTIYTATGSSYLSASWIHSIDTNGMVKRVAGNGIVGSTNDGGMAREAALNDVTSITVDRNGLVWIADQSGTKLRTIDKNGIITTKPFKVFTPYYYILNHFVVSPKNEILMFRNYADIFKLSESGVQKYTDGSFLVVDNGGSIAHKFDSTGRHLTTLDTTHGIELTKFNYYADGTLSEIVDRDGLKTKINRDSSGLPYSIVSPYGETTALSHDSDLRLSSFVDPGNRQTRFSYNSLGLIDSIIDPKGHESLYLYDRLGLLLSDEDAAGFKKNFARNSSVTHNEVTQTSPMGRVSVYKSRKYSDESQVRVQIAPDGTQTKTTENIRNDLKVEDSTGMLIQSIAQEDSRFGFAASIPLSVVATTPDGVVSKADYKRVVTLNNSSDFMSLNKLVDTATQLGLGTYTSTYERSIRLRTSQTPSGYINKETYNVKGRPVKLEVTNITPVSLAYDADGRLLSSTQGSRTSSVSYNSQGRVATETNALNQVTSYSYDAAGRVTQVQKPDGRLLKYTFDQNDNLTSVVLPKNQTHSYGFDVLDQMVLNTDPNLTGVNGAWSFSYNADRQSNKNTFPNGESFQYGYDTAGRLNLITTARGNFTYGYSTSGQLVSANSPENNFLSYDWDGSLLKSSTWSGQIAGSVAMNYGDQMRLISELIQNSVEVPYTYTPEGSVKSAGPLSLNYNSSNGLLLESVLGASTERFTYSAFGELATRNLTLDSGALYDESLTRDALGRITSLSRTVNGSNEVINYAYDVSGRLTSAAKAGAAAETYSYDNNDNRILDSDTVYDAQDRLTRNRDWTFTYNARGYLSTKTSRTTSAVVNYVYDNLGQLRSVTDNAGLNLSYIYDAQGRQIGKVKNGALSRGLIYRDQLRPAAELNPNGSLKSVFVYGSRSHVPEFMDRGGVLYRFVTDHLGSVRLVVNLSTKQVVQTISYDSWGKVLTDSNPGFQPFGYAGGIYDHETGLVRFGARDYDGRIGRWLDKDRIRFTGGMNFYVYVGNDPINSIDPTGFDSEIVLIDFFHAAVR
ncbi:MAG: choice-of-anchor D domain-containing protein, partial [Proteobacteria bacterium]